MNTPNTHTQLPENLLVIDREWLEEGSKNADTIVANYEDNKLLKDDEYYRYKGVQLILNILKANSYPLTQILEYYGEVITDSVKCHTYSKEVDYDEVYRDKQSFLSQPITLKKK